MQLSTVDGSADSDLEKFSDINSQDDALTREQKEQRLGLRKGMKTMAANFANKAGSLLKTTTQAIPGLSRAAGAQEENKMDVELAKEKAPPAKNEEDPEKMSEDEEKRILRMIDLEGSSDEDGESDEDEDNSAGKGQNQEAKQAGSDNDSFCSDNDILNRSLQSDCGDPVDAENYLRYASEKYNAKHDILEIVDKNERSFKQVAEKMIQQSSQLEQNQEAMQGQPQRKLMHMKVFKKIADRFHGDVQVAQGVPYSIAALEDFIAIGSSDGSVRLFDHSE